MSGERLQYIRRLDTLVPLVEHTDLLKLSPTGAVTVPDKLPAPTDEYGIPRPEIMIDELLDHMETKNFKWTGAFDLHHLATPKADFTIVRTKDEGDIGSAFRGASFLKIELPRQMHNFSHAIFELPARPSVEVMREIMTEVGDAKQLLETINDFYNKEGTGAPSDHAARLCLDALESKITKMSEPQIGLLPDLETLSQMNIQELRLATQSLLMVRRFSRRHLIHPAIYRRPYTPRIAA